MALSRKRKRELAKLKSQAESLWEDQRDVLEHASKVVRDARRQAGLYAKEEVSPRIREGVAATKSAAGSVASSTRDRFVDDVLPAVTAALGSAVAVVNAAKDANVRAAFTKATSLVKPEPVKSAGPGRYILIGVGVVAAAAVAYAAYQTLRADDDLWIEDEPLPVDPIAKTSVGTPAGTTAASSDPSI